MATPRSQGASAAAARTSLSFLAVTAAAAVVVAAVVAATTAWIASTYAATGSCSDDEKSNDGGGGGNARRRQQQTVSATDVDDGDVVDGGAVAADEAQGNPPKAAAVDRSDNEGDAATTSGSPPDAPPPVREVHLSPRKSGPEVPEGGGGADNNNENGRFRILAKGSITVVHGSVTGTCAGLARQLYDELSSSPSSSSSSSRHPRLQLAAADDFDWWDELINDDDDEEEEEEDNAGGEAEQEPAVLVVVLPTYTNGSWPPTAESLSTALDELLTDWRIAKFPLKGKLRVAAFGMGSSEYDTDGMGKPAKEAIRHFQRLGAKCLVGVQVGDDAVGSHAQTTFDKWQAQLMKHLMKDKKKPTDKSGGQCGAEDCCQNREAAAEKCCPPADDEEASYESEDEEGEPDVMDVEDMGDSILAAKTGTATAAEPLEMVTPTQAKALKKEGYRLIGTHSAVKLCRWTKHQLRGRGGCYKHTFYGITSYQCMEATPSLACANKCVFCWRHHKNPVGKEWRWKTDDPHYIVDQAVQEHIRMIKETRGIPGVQLERWKEAHTVRHCALSLVGEPIMYPRIDELLQDLHSRKISTFLVTNGQHPQAIGSIRPITQLYVSVDAPTKESLIAIDRPLFNDAWERLRESLSSLKAKGQRTVARLTVVKGWNSEEIAGYAKLIALGHVSLVEVKGVTFCGKSDASNLNMTNTPWHHEVVELTQTLKKEIDKLREQADKDDVGDIPPEYGLACEHKHSCSVLLARVDQFAVDDLATGRRTWRTWIDYDKFHELATRHDEDPAFTFSVGDYTAETPAWALFGSEEEGFDPTDKRHRKKQKYPKYTKFDENGIPTHDHNNDEIGQDERQDLERMMRAKMNEIGSGSTVTELKGGAREIIDASLMFRGLTVTK